MQLICFFLSVFCGILGGYSVVKLIYGIIVKKISNVYIKSNLKEKLYGRRKY